MIGRPASVLSAVIWLSCFDLGSAGAADSCAELGLVPDQLQNGQLFYRNQTQWVPLGSGQTASSTSAIASLVYIARETIDPTLSRSGTLIVKSGRTLVPGDPDVGSERRLVKLRRTRTLETDRCFQGLHFSPGSVSARSYDAYHDYGDELSDKTEQRRLDNFHLKYSGRQSACKSTNDTSWDAPLQWDFRSNRSQFSFDPTVVSSGMYVRTASVFRLTPAAASSATLVDQRVEIRRYSTGEGGLACVPFNVKITGANFFLRVNDLESRKRGTYLIRDAETSVGLVR